MKKRILSLATALILCASLITPAMAAETVVLTEYDPGNGGQWQVTITGVLAQENTNWETRATRTLFLEDGTTDTVADVTQESGTIYTVALDYAVTYSYISADSAQGEESTAEFISGYQRAQDGKYEQAGGVEAGSYYMFGNDGAYTSATEEEFFSKCDLFFVEDMRLPFGVWIQFEDGAWDTRATPTAVPSPCAATLDGKAVSLNAYLIQETGSGGSNYVMLRDIATLLNGTKAQFEVTWDKDKGIVLTTGQAYTPVGGELQRKGDGEKAYTANTSGITVDGYGYGLTAYTIEGNNYFKLRDLGMALGFNVAWDGATGTVIIDSTQSYSGTN